MAERLKGSEKLLFKWLYNVIMIWYEDNNLQIYFDKDISKVIVERSIDPYMSDEEIEDIVDYPFINTEEIGVVITDLRNPKLKQYCYTIPANTKSDGATIPRFVWSILGIHPLDPRVKEASFIHDWHCNYHSVIKNDRYLATLIFERMLKVAGVSKFKRALMFHCVDNFQKFLNWEK